MTLFERTRAGFVATYGEEPSGIAFAPGRVNLIGEHVDYNEGLVLPMPIPAGTAIAWGSANHDTVEAVALDLMGEHDRFEPNSAVPHQPVDWRSYVRGMAACWTQRGFPATGVRLAIAGNIARGSGLSSSASLCVAVGRALAAANGVASPPIHDLAFAAQQAEHEWAGVRCGIMDQMAVAAGEPEHALLLDCRSLAIRQVILPPDWAVMIVQSGVRRGLVDGHYNERRRDCEAAAAILGVTSLRDANAEAIAQVVLDPKIGRRARHVVSEIGRVSAAVEAISGHDLVALGAILRESHASLRDDFEVSVAAVDGLVECLNTAIGPVGGARMTGGGFGGAVVAVLGRSNVKTVAAAVCAAYRTPAGDVPDVVFV